MNIPTSLRAGDTWSWTESLSDYPAPTYTLKYTFWRFGESPKIVVASADGTDHSVDAAVATTIGLTPGTWNWTAHVEKGSAETLERYTVGEGAVMVKAALHAASGGSDFRSHAAKMLDAVEAVLENRATQAQSSLTIGGKAIAYMRHDELLQLRAYYRTELAAERSVSRVTRIQFGRS